jgi:hypothetical protein
MKTESTLTLSRDELQPTNGSSRNNSTRSVAPTAVRKGRHPLRVKTSVKAGSDSWEAIEEFPTYEP